MMDQPRIEAAVREILLAVGEDPDRDGLVDTRRAWLGRTGSFLPDCTAIRQKSSAPRLIFRTMRWC